MFRIFVIGLVICQAAAVLNNKAEAQRREIPADTYGPPLDLPAPVYGIPNGPVAHYPPPPPDVPPPPPQSYGVPIQKYGPPKVHLEYGPPKAPRPVYGPPQGHHHQHQHFQQQQQQHHHYQQQHEVSFLDQLKSTFGFGESAPPPQRRPHFPKHSYGPPPQSAHLCRQLKILATLVLHPRSAVVAAPFLATPPRLTAVRFLLTDHHHTWAHTSTQIFVAMDGSQFLALPSNLIRVTDFHLQPDPVITEMSILASKSLNHPTRKLIAKAPAALTKSLSSICQSQKQPSHSTWSPTALAKAVLTAARVTLMR